MINPLGLLITWGPAILLAGIIAAVCFYLAYRKSPEPKQRLSAGAYCVALAAAGAAAFVIGAAAGIWTACSGANAGNLCGLAGIFGSGPLLTGITIGGMGFLITRKARRTKHA